MKTIILKPNHKYLSKLYLQLSILFALWLMASGAFAALMAGEPDVGPSGARQIMFIAFLIGLATWLPGMALAAPYYRSLSYEIHEDEVIVRAGIITRSIKHVPYRTVTNLTIKRGLFDRYLFNLGTLDIQTAGMSGSTGAEESLAGLTDVEAVYDVVVEELRRFRGAMGPTATELTGSPVSRPPISKGTDLTVEAILNELQAIRHAVETK